MYFATMYFYHYIYCIFIRICFIAIQKDQPVLHQTLLFPQELRLDAASFKEKLKGCGQLSQLKERLAEFSRAAKTTGETQKQPTPKLSSPVKSETGNTERLLCYITYLFSSFTDSLLCYNTSPFSSFTSP